MLARKSALIISTQIANGLLGYVALFFIARYMDPEAYGVMAFAYSFVALFTIFAKLGYVHAHIKRVSEGKNLGKCIGTFIVTKTGLTGLMALLTIGAIFFWKFGLGKGFESPTHEIAVYIMLVYWIIQMFAQSFTATFKGRKEIAKAQLPAFFETLVRASAITYVALAGFGPIALVLTYIVGDVFFLITSLYFMKGYPIEKPALDYFKDYSKFALPLSIVVASGLIMTNIDKVLIQLFWSAADVGYYFAAFRLSMFINMFAASMLTLLFPTFSDLHSKNNIKEIRKLTFKSERYLSMIVFPMVFGMVILAEPTTRILLSGWMPAVPILQILPFFVLFAALESPYQSQLVGMNRPDLARNRILIMVVLNVIMNLILIPKDIKSFGLDLAGLGAIGAAIATVIAYGCGLIYSRYMALRLTNSKGNLRIVFHLVASIVMVITLYWFDTLFFISRWYHLLGLALLGICIYLFVLYFLREFTKKDMIFFLDALSINKMWKYIIEELRKNK